MISLISKTCVRNGCLVANHVKNMNSVSKWSKHITHKPGPLSSSLQSVRSAVTRHAKPAWFSDITPAHRRQVGVWLCGCAALCYGAVAIGGWTRLTESGLSMTQWHLIRGMKPPRTELEWLAEFERYKTFPEYEHVHKDITLEGFKKIFNWEYIHRMWGRNIGLLFFLPAFYFSAKKAITARMKPRMLLFGTLLVGQGLLGWYMVKSGLEPKPGPNDIPRVSQYRLAAHLSSALVLFSMFLWTGLSHLYPPHQNLPTTKQFKNLKIFSHVACALVFFTAVSGAFVAGLDAGLVYNSYPKFADRWIPSDLFAYEPKISNITENPTTVQFNHRHLAELTGATVLGMCAFALRQPIPRKTRTAALCMTAMILAQIGLGITTLMSQVNIYAASAHQQGSVVLLSLALWFMHTIRRVPK